MANLNVLPWDRWKKGDKRTVLFLTFGLTSEPFNMLKNPSMSPQKTFFLLYCFPLLMALTTCKDGTEKKERTKTSKKADRVVEKAMAHHGVEELDRDTITFDFRDKSYVYKTNDDRFQYERIFRDTAGNRIRDILTNEGFQRRVNDSTVSLPEKASNAYKHSVNSVIYFAFLPYKLNDPAVIRSYEGIDTIQETPYHRVRVDFKEEGGGKDHQDNFMYWFKKGNGRMDFLAYRYHQDEGGVRFREAFDRRRVDGILIQDYHNFKASYDAPLPELDEKWEKGALEKVSEIRLQNVSTK